MTQALSFTPQLARDSASTGGYPPKSHDTMPNELINNKFKDLARTRFLYQEEKRQKMSSLHRIIEETAYTFPKQFVRDRIADLPRIFAAIIDKDGDSTKY